MKTRLSGIARQRAFTKVELLALVAVLVVALVIFLPFFQEPKIVRSKMSCWSRLLGLYNHLEMFAVAHNGKFPSSVSTNDGGSMEWREIEDGAARHFRPLALTMANTDFLVCPEDNRKPAGEEELPFGGPGRMDFLKELTNSNLSYFINLSAETNGGRVVLAGDRNIVPETNTIVEIEPGRALTWNAKAGLHGDEGYLLFTDGHIEKVSSGNLSKLFQSSPGARLAVP